MNFGDLFRSMFGLPGKTREQFPPDSHPETFFREPERPDRDFFEAGPPSFFWGEFSDVGRPRDPGGFEDEDPTRGSHHWGPPPGFHSSAPDDMFRHFDEMFRSFDEVFRSMGMAEFPQFQPGLPSTERPPSDSSEASSLRDSMLKPPSDSHHRDNSEGQQPGQGPTNPRIDPAEPRSSHDHQPSLPSFFEKLWPMPKWSQPVMPQNPMDSDLDDAVRKGGLMTILQPSKVNPAPYRSDIHIMDPNTRQQPEGYVKRVHVYTYRGADGKVEERRTVEDERGNRETTVTRTLDDQSHSVTTKRTETGNMERKENLHNMDENDRNVFEQKWRDPPQLGVSVNPKHQYHPGAIFDLFRKGFPGFPSKS